MRINLVTPFSEKDAVKALGARWDAAKKIWYVTDVTDLTPFMRWIPNLETATEVSTDVADAAVIVVATGGQLEQNLWGLSPVQLFQASIDSLA
jgi:hypothetical protein